MSRDIKYIGMDVHKEAIVIAVLNVMKTMGHRDVRAAMQYQHPDLDIVRSALNRTNAPSLETAA